MAFECEDKALKPLLTLMALLVVSVCAHADSDDARWREMQLKVAKVYSQCGAYYEIAHSVLIATDSAGVADAQAMKAEAMIIAVEIATESEGAEKARALADVGFAAAIYDMHARIKNDPEDFQDWAAKQRRQCRMAVNDPPTFVKRTLAEYAGTRRTSPFISVPKDLTVEKILKHGRPVTSFPDISKCVAPGRDVTITLDDVLVEGGMVCTEHQGSVCDREQAWMSNRQYIESLYPNREFNGYSQTYSLSFKNGERQEKRTLIACLVLPETST